MGDAFVAVFFDKILAIYVFLQKDQENSIERSIQFVHSVHARRTRRYPGPILHPFCLPEPDD